MKKIFVFLCLFLLTSCQQSSTVELAGETIFVEIARTPKEQSLGLMHRTLLDPNKGMIFVYEDAAPRFFWMKNTLIPLDMIFIDSELKVLNIQTAQPCTLDPCVVYDSKGDAQYVLEVNAGFAQQHNLQPGDNVKLNLL